MGQGQHPAERAIRPLVITRKISGGTRSVHGSQTKMVLMSLLHTRQARGLDPLTAVEEMLLGTPIFAAKLFTLTRLNSYRVK